MLVKMVTRNALSVTRMLIFIKPKMDRKQSRNESRTVQDSKKQMMIKRKRWSRSSKINILFVPSVRVGITKAKIADVTTMDKAWRLLDLGFGDVQELRAKIKD